MDKYLELIEKQEKLLVSLETTIARKEEELTRLDTMLNTEQEREKINSEKYSETKENIAFLKKYDGKNILWQNIKEVWTSFMNEFKTSLLLDKFIYCISIIFVGGVILFTSTVSPLLPIIISSFGLSFLPFIMYLPERLELKRLRKSTSIEDEELELQELENELTLIKESSKEIKSKIEETKKELKSVYIKKNQLTIDIDTVKKLREQIVESMLNTDLLNKAFVAEPTISDILKRTRKEGK